VEDVCWSCFNEELFASVGDDKRVVLWDRRREGPALRAEEAHSQEVMCVDASPFDPYLLLTGSTDSTVALWDQRNMGKPIFWLRGHSGDITQAKFSPMQANLVASSSADKRVIVWDLAKIKEEGTEDQPEMMFVHGGHQAKVSDIAWNLNEKLTIASVCEENIL
jgi:histone-binding protein RBBP4